jgi:prolipoprotein diacylglyceryltransferase
MHRFYKNKPDKIPNGMILTMYLGIYSLYRTFIEYYRVDSSYIGPVKVVYIINAIYIIAALIISNYLINKFREKKRLENIEE